MIEIEKAFNPETKSVHDFFQRPGVGFYIPLYQREYSWDEDNVIQLLDDIGSGIGSIVSEKDDREVRFLGTIITVTEPNKQDIEPQDPQGLPSTIEKIIDGQQRLSTIALLAARLYVALDGLKEKLMKFPDTEREIEEISDEWMEKLEDVFSLNLKRGTPKLKPKIIRGNRDAWTKDGDIEKYYQSPVARFLAKSIQSMHDGSPLPKHSTREKVGQNVKRMDIWIKNSVLNAHVTGADDFASARTIFKGLSQEYIWSHNRPALVEAVSKVTISDKKSFEYQLSSMVQLLAVCHYLLDRCCFTIIQPYNDDWAFDMFQSLNATGTPLTAIETFKPLVDNITKKNEKSFLGSKAEKSFQRIEALFASTKSAAQKSKRTNDFLTSFGIVIDGGKLQSHFSKQRKWLDSIYSNQLENYESQVAFIDFMANYAQFFREYWVEYNGANGDFASIQSAPPENAAIASILLLVLRESNHKMAITILGRFYEAVLRGEENSISEFITATKATAAFYLIWRSALPNAGLDNVYREFSKGTKENTENRHAWLHKRILDSKSLIVYFNQTLDRFGIGNRTDWHTKAVKNLRYDKAKQVARFAIFFTSHETIPDAENPGLMKLGAAGTSQYNAVSQWISPDLKTIEHVAPIKNENGLWDELLYDEDEWYQSIGNLTLLPKDVNTSASNRGWKEKIIYYRHISEQDPQKQQELRNRAKLEDINLSEKALEILQNARFNAHIRPIVEIGEAGGWNLDLVKARTDRICEIFWDRVSGWLDLK